MKDHTNARWVPPYGHSMCQVHKTPNPRYPLPGTRCVPRNVDAARAGSSTYDRIDTEIMDDLTPQPSFRTYLRILLKSVDFF